MYNVVFTKNAGPAVDSSEIEFCLLDISNPSHFSSSELSSSDVPIGLSVTLADDSPDTSEAMQARARWLLTGRPTQVSRRRSPCQNPDGEHGRGVKPGFRYRSRG